MKHFNYYLKFSGKHPFICRSLLSDRHHHHRRRRRLRIRRPSLAPVGVFGHSSPEEPIGTVHVVLELEPTRQKMANEVVL